MSQRFLFDNEPVGTDAYGRLREPTLPHNGKQASKAAALKMCGGKAAEDRARLLAYIRSCGEKGSTRQEAEAALGMDQNSLRPRWWELDRAGLIEYCGRHRRNAAGNITEVYTVTGSNDGLP